ncbi:thermonuclease family protein [Microvirga sp. M2]|uniref:thermonuclease family protein n=1 Tax=Microvirga sp. M2 TaxID=3073270 RepID=UPI0039C49C0F
MAIGVWAVIATGFGAMQVSASPHPGRAAFPGCAGETRQDRLADITPEGELLLEGLGLARLPGIRLPDDGLQRGEALDWLRARIGQPLVVTVQGGRDRWNRLPLRARLGEPQPLDLGHGLVEAGLALVDPGADSVFCQTELLAFEETARERRLGLWADDRYNPVPVGQAELLRERVGRFVIIEGRVRSVGERKQRTYLNFGGHWAEDFTIIIPRKAWIRMAERGISAASLKGRPLRARGILQSWQGTALAIDLPEMIERLEDRRLQGDEEEDRRLAR